MINEHAAPPSLEMEDYSRAFKALGDSTRLNIIAFLRQAEEQGMPTTVGDVSMAVTGINKANPRISFHLKELRTSGLIHVEKQGKFIICRVQWERLAALSTFLASANVIAETINS